jgi:hypothetical protein
MLAFSSCKNDEQKIVEKNVFSVSKFNNNNIEKRTKEANAKNPELSTIKEVELYDFPKRAVNFIISKSGKVYFYNEELIWNCCG